MMSVRCEQWVLVIVREKEAKVHREETNIRLQKNKKLWERINRKLKELFGDQTSQGHRKGKHWMLVGTHCENEGRDNTGKSVTANWRAKGDKVDRKAKRGDEKVHTEKNNL